jgi:hypothetical protein
MTEQISDSTSLTHLSALAEQAIASDAWWKADAEPRNELALPSRVLAILDKAGIRKRRGAEGGRPEAAAHA